MDRRDPDGSVIQRLLDMIGATIEYNALSAKEGFDAFDMDADGLISPADFAASAARFDLRASAAAIRQLHSALDVDRDGVLSRAEWEQGLRLSKPAAVLKDSSPSSRSSGMRFEEVPSGRKDSAGRGGGLRESRGASARESRGASAVREAREAREMERHLSELERTEGLAMTGEGREMTGAEGLWMSAPPAERALYEELRGVGNLKAIPREEGEGQWRGSVGRSGGRESRTPGGAHNDGGRGAYNGGSGGAYNDGGGAHNDGGGGSPNVGGSGGEWDVGTSLLARFNSLVVDLRAARDSEGRLRDQVADTTRAKRQVDEELAALRTGHQQLHSQIRGDAARGKEWESTKAALEEATRRATEKQNHEIATLEEQNRKGAAKHAEQLEEEELKHASEKAALEEHNRRVSAKHAEQLEEATLQHAREKAVLEEQSRRVAAKHAELLEEAQSLRERVSEGGAKQRERDTAKGLDGARASELERRAADLEREGERRESDREAERARDERERTRERSERDLERDLWRRKEISLTQRLEAERADRDALQQRLDEYRTRHEKVAPASPPRAEERDEQELATAALRTTNRRLQEKLNEAESTISALQRENDAALEQIERSGRSNDGAVEQVASLSRRVGHLDFELTCARGEVARERAQRDVSPSGDRNSAELERLDGLLNRVRGATRARERTPPRRRKPGASKIHLPMNRQGLVVFPATPSQQIRAASMRPASALAFSHTRGSR